MFSLRPYRSLGEEEDAGKSAVLLCALRLEPPSGKISSSTTTTTDLPPSTPLSLHQTLKAAWRNLKSCGSSRLPHLEQQQQRPRPASPPHDYRYTHFPRRKETAFHHTHIHLTPASRTYTHPHRSPVPPPPPESSKCLRKRKSKSDNALHQRVVTGVVNSSPSGIKSHSDQNLHNKATVFSNVHLCRQRSRSLERNQGNRVHPTVTHSTRSLERNHKFRVESDEAVLRGVMDGGGASFINKPPRGWLHQDQQLAEEGVCYGVRYIGCLKVNTSMKSLNFDTRSLIAKECISRVCEAAGLKTADRKRKVLKTIGRILGDRPHMEHAGSNVTLTITSTALTLTVLESGQVVACHDMPNISFASGGDPDTLDFIAYVAKDVCHGRACFVLECGGGLAQDVITTIGQAFELRFKEYLKRTPSIQYTSVKSDRLVLNNNEIPSGISPRDDMEYYNDMPGKVPPDLPPPPVPPLPQYSAADGKRQQGISITVTHANHSTTSTIVTTSANHQPLNNRGKSLDETGMRPATGRSEPEYVNDAVIKQKQLLDQKDPFDMQPFSMQLSQLGDGVNSSSMTGIVVLNNHVGPAKTLPLSQRLQLQSEPWFHGAISRKDAEQLLTKDGDFLVRESQGTAGQYVLTGIQNSTKKHLLLVDPEGVVRTKSRTFDSVSHLIRYHQENGLPIVSAESALVLRTPVLRKTNH